MRFLGRGLNMKKLIAIGLFLNAALMATLVGLLSRGGVDVAHAADGSTIPIGSGDVNGDGALDISDVVYLAEALYLGGPAPVPTQCPSPILPLGTTVGRFVDNGDQTISDTLTGLMWPKTAAAVSSQEWGPAATYCQNLTFAGHSDWRLPNIRELESLLKFEDRNNPNSPYIDPVFAWSSGRYWSITTVDSGPSLAFYLDTGQLEIGGGQTTNFTKNNVLPVRSLP